MIVRFGFSAKKSVSFGLKFILEVDDCYYEDPDEAEQYCEHGYYCFVAVVEFEH